MLAFRNWIFVFACFFFLLALLIVVPVPTSRSQQNQPLMEKDSPPDTFDYGRPAIQEDLAPGGRPALPTVNLPSAIFPTVYNANTQIVQAPGVVAITYEMIHDTRIVFTDGRTHVGGAIRGYQGDSRGHWEGDTLVVDVTNFSPKADYRGAGETLHLVERFTRTANGLRYEASVDDPHTWTASWTAALEMAPQREAMFEYACHEGNNSMRNILSGARAAER